MLNELKVLLSGLTGCNNIKLTSRGNTAIRAAVKIAGEPILIPEEGGWMEYLKFEHEQVKCDDAQIDLVDLEIKLKTNKFKAFLYANPGAYCAEEPVEEIYQLCKKYNCRVILDISGSIGTNLPKQADILVGSFGRWKPVNAECGGFIASNKKLPEMNELDDREKLTRIHDKLLTLQSRLDFLVEKRKKIISDLNNFNIIHKDDFGIVVIIKNNKQEVIDYCKKNQIEYTECPRYIRINQEAISVEVKRLS
jgi:hypothetical protein